MTNVRIALMGMAVACLIGARPALSQVDTSPSRALPVPAHVSIVDGAARIEREGRAETAVVNIPLLDGDRLRTDAGRVEVLFPDGSALHVDQHTTVDLLAPDLLRLVEGRILLLVAGADDPARAVRYQVDAPAASVQADGPGEYRVSIVGNDVELAVITGSATFATDLGSVPVRAGERSVASPSSSPTSPSYFNSARADGFDRWSNDQREERVGQVSSRYLPADLRTYSGTFDRYGNWERDDTYGDVWYPAAPAAWRPYQDGYWNTYPGYGSVWIGMELWSWPTHHFGRWGVSLAGRWFWIPARTWGPAWVYWAVNQDYVGWCPLGWNNDPVYGMWGVRGAFNYSHHDPWRGWTVVPSHLFGRHESMARIAIDGRRLDDRVRTSFIAQRTSPRQYAVPRSGVPVREVAGERRTIPQGAAGLAGAARGSSDRFGSATPGAPRTSRGGQVQAERRGPGQAVRPGDSPGRDSQGSAFAASRRTVPGAPDTSARQLRDSSAPNRGAGVAAGPDRRNSRELGSATAGPRYSREAVPPSPGVQRQFGAPTDSLRRFESPSPRQRNDVPAPRTRYEAPPSGPRQESRPAGGFAVPRYQAPPRDTNRSSAPPSPRYNSRMSAPQSSSPSRAESRPRGDARTGGSARPRGGGNSRR
jgi:hypothetical protein